MVVWDDFDAITTANLVLRSIGFVAGVLILILSFVRSGLHSNGARHGSSWFRVSLVILLISILLAIITIALVHLDAGSISRKDGKTIRNIPLVANFFETQAFATVTMIQLGLAIGYRYGDVSDGANTGRTTHVCGLFGYALVTILNIAELATSHEYLEYLSDSMYASSSYHGYESMLALNFVIYLFLCIGAFTVLAYTASVREVSHHAIYFLLVAAAVASFVRSLYSVIISGIYDLALLKDDISYLPEIPEGLPIIATIMLNWIPLVAFGCILFASKERLKTRFNHDIE